VHWYRDKKQLGARLKQYSALTQQIRLTGPLNGDRMKNDLHRLRPDFIVLGGIGILHESVLRLAERGVINCHPGLLPWVRGTGVVAGAIRRGVPVGCTCHYVDHGIDTGAVIERRLLPITSGELSLSAIEQAANALATCTLADVVAEQIMRGMAPVAVKQPSKLPMSKWPSTAEREVIEQQVRGGRALMLFEGWRRSCVDERRYQLPSDFDGHPAEAVTSVKSSEGR
jgi:methionyl-tRNA formyltransferase